MSTQEAETKAAQVDYLLLRLKQRLIDLPPGAEIADFMQNDGRPPKTAVAGSLGNTSLVTLRDRFLAMHAGAHEKNTLYTARIHFNHLIATLGDKFPLRELALADPQRHVTRRAADGIAPATIKKEINGFRAAWNWGRRIGLVTPEWPDKGLVYQKTSEKPPFQTRAEVARRIARGGLTDQQKAELYESLYLTAEELPQFLEQVLGAARHAFIYPMICMAAHTGMRRSELIRAEVAGRRFREPGGDGSRKKAGEGPTIVSQDSAFALPGQGIERLAITAPRRQSPVLPRGRGRSQQETQPDHWPPGRKDTSNHR